MNRVIAETDFAAAETGDDEALALYRDILRARRFDERTLSLQRQGWMSSYPQFRGQEASQVGAAHALMESDWLFPTYRSNAMQIARGVPMSDILLFRRGHPEFHSDHDLPHFPQAVPIATQIPHAVGVGMAMNYTGDDGAVCCYLGDGATSEGDFHEGMNFAGVFETPVVFFCENNGWAISLPTHRQTASATIAQKATAFGFDGVRVDGNDPIAVLNTVRSALETARSGTPVLVESLTYRQGAHSTSDDPSVYADRQESLPEWRTRDPLERYEQWLRDGGVLGSGTKDAIEEAVETELDAAVETAESVPTPPPEAVFDRVYERCPDRLESQRTWLRSFVEETGSSTARDQ